MTLSSYKVLTKEKELIEDIQSKSENLLEVLEDFQQKYTEEDFESAVFVRAFNFTHDLVAENAFDLLMIEAQKAIINSVEFNYPLFITHFMRSMELSNSEKSMIEILVDTENKVVTGVNINLSGMGSIEEYAGAVERARELLGIGKINPNSGGEGKTRKIGAEVRSDIWREKIYGVAREGVRVLRRYVGKKKKSAVLRYRDKPDRSVYKDDSEDQGTVVDITSRYNSKYHNTIEARLSVLGSRAAYWEIIDKGNSGIELSSSIGGTEYPSVPASNFVNKTRIAISDAVKNAYQIYKVEAEEFLSGLIAKDYGVESWTPSVKGLERGIKEKIAKEMSPELIKERLETGETASEVIRTDRGQYKFKVTSTGKGSIPARDRFGRYAKLESIIGK